MRYMNSKEYKLSKMNKMRNIKENERVDSVIKDDNPYGFDEEEAVEYNEENDNLLEPDEGKPVQEEKPKEEKSKYGKIELLRIEDFLSSLSSSNEKNAGKQKELEKEPVEEPNIKLMEEPKEKVEAPNIPPTQPPKEEVKIPNIPPTDAPEKKVETPNIPPMKEPEEEVETPNVPPMEEPKEKVETPNVPPTQAPEGNSRSGKNNKVKEDEEDVQEEPKQRINKEIFLEIVMDGTLSFTTIYPKIYYIMKTFLEKMKSEKGNYPNVVIKYGLTIFHDKKGVETKLFLNKSHFTAYEEEVLQHLEEMKFYGGSVNGKEDLASAFETALQRLEEVSKANTVSERRIARGILMFSDSCPEDSKKKPDFRRYKGLRFVQIFANTEEFNPLVTMVDGEGNLTYKNKCEFMSLEKFLEQDRDVAEEIIDRFLHQTSIN